MIRVDVVELVMGTVREGTDAAGTPVGELVGGATCRAIGMGRVLGSVCGTLAVSIRLPVFPVVVMTASAIAWFSTVAGEELGCRYLVFHVELKLLGLRW